MARPRSASLPGSIPPSWDWYRPDHGSQTEDGRSVKMFHGIVPKMRQRLTLLATIGNDFGTMKILGVISVLALLTMTVAIYTDQLFTSDQIVQRSN